MNPLKLSSEEVIKIEAELKQRHFDLMSASWEAMSTKKNIKSWIILPTDGKIPILRAESKIKCSAQNLFDYLVTDINQTCKEWNNLMLYSGSLKKYRDTIEISRIVSEGNIVADREDVFIRCSGKFDNGNIYEVSQGFDETFVPINTSISKYTVRSEMYFSSKEIIPISKNSCLYKTIWHYDPSGWLNKLIPRKMLGNIILKNLVHEHQKLANIFPKK